MMGYVSYVSVVWLTCLLSVLILAEVTKAEVVRLETYNVDATSVTVSGVSSGGCMATQMHVALSSKFSGAGILAGVPYYCAEGNITKSLRCADTPSSIDAARLALLTLEFESKGEIDSISNLINDRVWIFHGALDSVVHPDIGATIVDYYSNLGLAAENIYLRTDFPAEHSVPTEDQGGPCEQINRQDAYLNLCGYEASYEVMNFLYGGSLIRASSSTNLTGQYLEFNQTEFITVLSGSSMDETGIAYVPSGCVDKTKQCRLHVAFHGCNQGKFRVDDTFTLQSGYCQAGELNNIIILFPQAVPSDNNPLACWDWWGYNDPTGSNIYATKYGLQTEACGRMVDRIMGLSA